MLGGHEHLKLFISRQDLNKIESQVDVNVLGTTTYVQRF
jgi:hypothetical protein